jgi:hypothetical protein
MNLMLAARVQNREDHEIRIREKQLFGARTGGLGRAGQFAEVPIAGQSAEMVQANSGQAGNFVFGEELLARFDSHHVSASR